MNYPKTHAAIKYPVTTPQSAPRNNPTNSPIKYSTILFCSPMFLDESLDYSHWNVAIYIGGEISVSILRPVVWWRKCVAIRILDEPNLDIIIIRPVVEVVNSWMAVMHPARLNAKRYAVGAGDSWIIWFYFNHIILFRFF